MNEETVPNGSEGVSEGSETVPNNSEDTSTTSETSYTVTETSEPVPINYDEAIFGELMLIRWVLVFMALLMLASRFVRGGR